MKNTPIERRLIDETIEDFHIADFAKATIREVKAIAAKAEAASDPKEPSSSEIAFTEFFDDTTDRISGTRLLMMLQTGRQKASFSKQGITIRVPRASLPKDIQNNDQIEVIIKKISDRSFSFSFCINGVSFDSLPGASVMLPYPQETTADSLYLCDENGTKVPVSDYDDAAKAASFPIDHTGTYTMAASKDPDSPALTADAERGRSPLLFLLPASLLLLSAGVLFLRRRWK